MTVRIPSFPSTAALCIACLVALAACAGGGEPDPVQVAPPAMDVRATPRPGYIEVTWSDAGTESYDIFREDGAGSTVSEEGFRIVGTVPGDVQTYRDVDVEPSVSYRYAVAAAGDDPVAAAGSAVRPEPGHVLRIEFATAVPTGADFAVVSEPAGIECAAAGGTACAAVYPAIADVTLGVQAEAVAWTWDGCDAASAGTCRVEMSTDRTVTVSLTLANTLDVVVDPVGSGVVTNVNDLAPNPAVACTSDCSYAYPAGLAIGLDAEPADADQYRFVGWGGACADDTCTVIMDGDRRVEARFSLRPPAIESFTASPDSVSPGESATLAWDVSGGGNVASGELSISIDPGVGELSARTGTVEVSPSVDTTYTLSVSNASGAVERSAMVSVDTGAPPVIELFTASEYEIDEGDRIWLRWSVSGPGPKTVTIEPGVGNVPNEGRRKVSPQRDTTYVLTAQNDDGVATAELDVEVDDDDDDDDDDAVGAEVARRR